MLPKTHRLSKTQLSVKTPSQTRNTPYFSLKYRKNDLTHHCFGFVISKKVDKRAVVRNALKRKMAAAVVGLEARSGYDMIFYMKKAAVEATEKELERGVTDVLK